MQAYECVLGAHTDHKPVVVLVPVTLVEVCHKLPYWPSLELQGEGLHFDSSHALDSVLVGNESFVGGAGEAAVHVPLKGGDREQHEGDLHHWTKGNRGGMACKLILNGTPQLGATHHSLSS